MSTSQPRPAPLPSLRKQFVDRLTALQVFVLVFLNSFTALIKYPIVLTRCASLPPGSERRAELRSSKNERLTL